MKLFTIVFERLPMVWVLLGLLFNALGLYLGFENSFSFLYLVVGWFCCAYGAALFVLQFRERPKDTKATRLSRNFIAVGDTTAMMPAMPHAESERPAEQDSPD